MLKLYYELINLQREVFIISRREREKLLRQDNNERNGKLKDNANPIHKQIQISWLFPDLAGSSGGQVGPLYLGPLPPA